MVAQIHPVDPEERVVAITGRTVFEQASDLVSRLRSVEIAAKYRARPRRTSLANGPCSMFNREALLAVGGFDPEWYHAEDMEVSLRLIQAGGTIVYARDALVRHVPETGASHFLAKRRRDARAHVRIVRSPQAATRWTGFDFLGSSTVVLCMLPMWLAVLILFVPSALGLMSDDLALGKAMFQQWEGQALVASITVLLIQEVLVWRGRKRRQSGGRAVNHREQVGRCVGVRRMILRWSLALWHGLFLGVLDAVLGRNGHRRA